MHCLRLMAESQNIRPFNLASPMFSRHGIAQTSLALLIWLNENIPFNFP